MNLDSSPHSLLESFRFENDNEYEYEINWPRFNPGKLLFSFFSLKKLVRLIILKEVKPSPESKMIKRLTFENLFPPLRHSR